MSRFHQLFTHSISRLPHFFLCATMCAIPFYQIRIPIYETSLSVLTCALCVFIVVCSIQYHHLFTQTIRANRPLFFFALLFCLSFIPSLIRYPSVHAYGVFVEWIFLPLCAGVCMAVHIHHTKSNTIILRTATILLLCISCVAIGYFLTGTVTYDHRLSAFFLSPNHLALCLSPLIMLACAYYVAQKKRSAKILTLFSLFAGMFVVVLTQSFSVKIALAITLCGILCTYFKKHTVFFIVLLSCLLCIFGWQKYHGSDTIFARNSLSSRITIWHTAIHYVQQKPLIGYPLDDFQNLYLEAQPLYPPYLEWAVPTPHNLLFVFYLSGGFVSVVSFCCVCTYTLTRGFLTFRKTHTRTILYTTGALCIILLTGIVDTPYWKNDLAYLFWIIVFLHNATHLSSVRSNMSC